MVLFLYQLTKDIYSNIMLYCLSFKYHFWLCIDNLAGVVIGAVVWFTAELKHSTPKVHTDIMSCKEELDPPENLYLQLQFSPNQSVYFSYAREELLKDLDVNNTVSTNTFGDRVSKDFIS